MIDKSNIYNVTDDRDPSNLGRVAPIVVGGYFGKKFVFDKLIQQKAGIAGTGIKRGNLKYLQGYSMFNGSWTKESANSIATIQEVMWNAIRGSEEVLLKFPRAISASTIFGSKILRQQEIFMSGSEIEGQRGYLENILNLNMSDEILAKGLTIKKGAIYQGRGIDGKTPIGFGRVMPGTSFDGVLDRYGRDAAFTPRYIKSSHGIFGLGTAKQPAYIIGGKTRFAATKNAVNAYGTNVAENLMRLLDDPFEFTNSLIEAGTSKSGRLTRFLDSGSSTLNKLGLRNIFGVGGRSNMRNLDMLGIAKKHLKTGFPRIAAVTAGIFGINALLRTLPFLNNTVAGTGIPGIAGKAYQDATQAYGAFSDITGLTTLSKFQEYQAPGSTSLLSTLAFPTSFGIAGLTLGSMMDIAGKHNAVRGADALPWQKFVATSMESMGGNARKFSSAFELSKMGRKGMFGMIGAAIGVAATIPTLLGKLGSKDSSKELRDTYDGKRKVEIKRGRFWTFGLEAFEGGDTKMFAPHWSVRALTQADWKGRMPQEYIDNPLRQPLERLLDPYALEKKLDKDRPYAYWGPQDYGLGFVEQVLNPLKQLMKPTTLAHPEGRYSGTSEPNPIPSPGSAGGYGSFEEVNPAAFSPDPVTPGGPQSSAYNLYASLQDAAGFHGFLGGAVMSKMTGVKHPFQPMAQYSTSADITSVNRQYWDSDLGDMFGANEAYRRMNYHIDYGTEYISSNLQNTQPSWMPDKFKTGDPYAKIQMGDIRLPGTGYAALHPEMDGVAFENYDQIHRLNILNDVSPDSSQFEQTLMAVKNQQARGDLNQGAIDMLGEIMRQRDIIREGKQFDNGRGPLGAYYLAMKKIGRALPTENLYPISPVHKFAGPVDAATEYRDKMVLDSTFKDWSSPISDYVIPSLNKTINTFSMTPYIPRSATRKYETEMYFQALQNKKNDNLEKQARFAEDSGSSEVAKYYRSAVKKTIFDVKVDADANEVASAYSMNKRSYIRGMLRSPDADALKYVSPDIQNVLKAQWKKRQKNVLPENYTPTGPSIGASVDYQVAPNELPDNDHVSYAPGVNLNAFKTKVVNKMGENVRKYELWHKDEMASAVLDSRMDAGPMFNNNQSLMHMSSQIDQQLVDSGMFGSSSALPSNINPGRYVNLRTNDRDEIKRKMREDGWITRSQWN